MKHLLFAGLGNPGVQYEHTRHNIGIRALRAWVNGTGASVKEWKRDVRVNGEVYIVRLEGAARVDCVFPLSYMNRSGSVVAAYVRMFDIAFEDVLLIHDDMELAFGDVRIKESGSAAGHNGVRSVHEVLNTHDIRRIRVGIGRPLEDVPADAFVLAKFTQKEEEHIPAVVRKVCAMLSEEI